MIKQLFRLPDKYIVACSGGKDSMAILHFLHTMGKNIEVCFFDHGTEFSEQGYEFVRAWCRDHDGLILWSDSIKGVPEKNESYEAFWSRKRNEWFQSLPLPVVTAHHLNDAVEWWIYSSIKGNSSLMGAKNKNVLRPFIITPQRELYSWVDRKNVPYINDPSNDDTSYMRNYIRNKMMQDILHVNSGLLKTIKKKYLKYME